MNLNKHLDFVNTTETTAPIHIVGCGALGSRVAELLIRLGFGINNKIVLWDFDTVDEHNITNQLYRAVDVGQPKLQALASMLLDINPKATIQLKREWTGQLLSGYIFMAVDNIDIRRAIVERHMESTSVNAMFDMRMRLTDAQAYGADWSNKEHRTNLLNTMQFTNEEAMEATPVSACGTTLSVLPTVMTVSSFVVSNFLNHLRGQEIKNIILLDAFDYSVNAF